VKRIVFVDDELRVLSGLRRQLHGHRAEWDMSFVDGGEAALAALAQAAAGQPIDVIVSDMRMPGMDGAQLLSRVAREHPRVGRIVLSGHADLDRMQLARSCAHRYLNKPCGPETLEAEIRRALAVRESLDSLGWASADELWRAPPGIFAPCAEVFGSLSGEQPSDVLAANLAQLCSQDARLWRQLGPLLGAAFPAQTAPGTSPPALAPAAALSSIGARPLMALAMARRFFEAFVARRPDGEQRWDHALRLAGRMAAVSGDALPAEVVVHALAAALLQLSDEPCVEEDVACDDRCRDVLDYLLPTWGFPEPVVAAVAWRRKPRRCPPSLSAPLAALAAAELLHAWSEGAAASDRERELLDFLQQRGWSVPQRTTAPGLCPQFVPPAGR